MNQGNILTISSSTTTGTATVGGASGAVVSCGAKGAAGPFAGALNLVGGGGGRAIATFAADFARILGGGCTWAAATFPQDINALTQTHDKLSM
jgi:hypothetical protein